MSALNKKSVKDIDVSGKRVLVRCDFNVPLQDGKITSDKRIVASLPTIKYLIDHHAKVILCSHLGRPKGEFKPEFSLAPVAARLSELLGQDVKMAKDVIGDSAKELAANLKDGEVMLLENVRFHAEETKNDPAFSKALASLADIYVNDAFGSAHRAHSSTTGVADYLPAVCGFLIQKEIEFMGGALENPKRPSSLSSAAQRYPIKSVLSTTFSTRSTCSSSAAAWPILSSSPRAIMSAPPCLRPTRSSLPRK